MNFLTTPEFHQNALAMDESCQSINRPWFLRTMVRVGVRANRVLTGFPCCCSVIIGPVIVDHDFKCHEPLLSSWPGFSSVLGGWVDATKPHNHIPSETQLREFQAT